MVPDLRVLIAAGHAVLLQLRVSARRARRCFSRSITHSNHAVARYGIPATVRAADAAADHHTAAHGTGPHAAAYVTGAAGGRYADALAGPAGRSAVRRLAVKWLAASGTTILAAPAVAAPVLAVTAVGSTAPGTRLWRAAVGHAGTDAAAPGTVPEPAA
jgi:hypothetical protein